MYIFYYFSDAVTTERAVELAANTKGLCYIRLSRPATEVSFNYLFLFSSFINKSHILIFQEI